MFDDVHQYHVLRTMLASSALNMLGVCTMPSNHKISSTFVVGLVCYDSLGDVGSDKSAGLSSPPNAADQVDVSTLSNLIAAPTMARDLRRACE